MPQSDATNSPQPALPFCACIALGSNLGDRLGYLQAALRGLAGNPQIRPCAVSAVYETEPVGPVAQGAYLNAVLKVQTSLRPEALLLECQRIETLNGRVRAERFGPRTLDLDILLHSAAEQLNLPQLCLPHPRMHERAFVLTPLADIAPEELLQGRSVSEWLALQPQADRLGVRRIAEQLHVEQMHVEQLHAKSAAAAPATSDSPAATASNGER